MSKVANRKQKVAEEEETEWPTRAPSSDEEDDVVGKKVLSKAHLQKMMEGRRNKGSLTKRLSLSIPPRLMQRRLRNDKIVATIPLGSAIYAAGAVERLIDDIMASARDIAATERKQVVSSRHIMAALKGDEELGRMFKNVTIAQGGIGHPKTSSRMPIIPTVSSKKKTKTKPTVEEEEAPMEDEEQESDEMGDADDSQEY